MAEYQNICTDGRCVFMPRAHVAFVAKCRHAAFKDVHQTRRERLVAAQLLGVA
ncbi:hypothetical protein QEZ40_007102 [Streptomyces katrae]|uniref:Uncharacterized protein n=1 Tax=Streptomyces katrae TaxID=68223 RepID=A0ABT7GQB9_9ACTN|nr:hypothetical protein [Streptomyces katrae]MDK9495806.1 hypothetical protein [Streptomyces katrae]